MRRKSAKRDIVMSSGNKNSRLVMVCEDSVFAPPDKSRINLSQRDNGNHMVGTFGDLAV